MKYFYYIYYKKKIKNNKRMRTFQQIMKSSRRSVHQTKNMDIFPCHKNYCLCVEYLNFRKEKDRNRYKHCYITSVNNAKYKDEKNTYNTQPYDSLYEFHKSLVNLDSDKSMG